MKKTYKKLWLLLGCLFFVQSITPIYAATTVTGKNNLNPARLEKVIAFTEENIGSSIMNAMLSGVFSLGQQNLNGISGFIMYWIANTPDPLKEYKEAIDKANRILQTTNPLLGSGKTKCDILIENIPDIYVEHGTLIGMILEHHCRTLGGEPPSPAISSANPAGHLQKVMAYCSKVNKKKLQCGIDSKTITEMETRAKIIKGAVQAILKKYGGDCAKIQKFRMDALRDEPADTKFIIDRILRNYCERKIGKKITNWHEESSLKRVTPVQTGSPEGIPGKLNRLTISFAEDCIQEDSRQRTMWRPQDLQECIDGKLKKMGNSGQFCETTYVPNLHCTKEKINEILRKYTKLQKPMTVYMQTDFPKNSGNMEINYEKTKVGDTITATEMYLTSFQPSNGMRTLMIKIQLPKGATGQLIAKDYSSTTVSFFLIPTGKYKVSKISKQGNKTYVDMIRINE